MASWSVRTKPLKIGDKLIMLLGDDTNGIGKIDREPSDGGIAKINRAEVEVDGSTPAATGGSCTGIRLR